MNEIMNETMTLILISVCVLGIRAWGAATFYTIATWYLDAPREAGDEKENSQ